MPGTKLRVLGPARSSGGNQCVLVRCEAIVGWRVCGKEKVMRVTDMTRRPFEDKDGKVRLPCRSCGCQARRTNREYWERRARGFSRRFQQDIYWAMVSGHRSPAELKRRYKDKLPVNLITTIFRLYSENPSQRRERRSRRRRRSPW